MAAPRNGILHQYTTRLSAFEHTSKKSISASNLIIFIGGLSDGLGTIPYTRSISDSLDPNWTLAEAIITSSYKGWGTSSLQKDVSEISKCVEYFRNIKSGLIILMGHSTGSQDVMEYLTGPGYQTRPPIDGGIIQAPGSDREFIISRLDPQVYTQSCLDAQAMVDAGRGDDVMPTNKEIKNILDCPISASRWLSLASPNRDGDDDYFTSDLSTAQLMKSFGNLPIRTLLCILISGSDECMPDSIDKTALLKRWTDIIVSSGRKYDAQNSTVVEGASHNLSGNKPEVVNDLVQRVLGFLVSVQSHSNQRQ